MHPIDPEVLARLVAPFAISLYLVLLGSPFVPTGEQAATNDLAAKLNSLRLSRSDQLAKQIVRDIKAGLRLDGAATRAMVSVLGYLLLITDTDVGTIGVVAVWILVPSLLVLPFFFNWIGSASLSVPKHLRHSHNAERETRSLPWVDVVSFTMAAIGVVLAVLAARK